MKTVAITVRVPSAVRAALADEAEARFATAADVARGMIVAALIRSGRLSDPAAPKADAHG